MQLPRALAPAALTFATLIMATASSRSADHATAAGVNRARAHLDSVLVELGHRDVSVLTESQRARRARLVTELRAYRDRGVFPHNYDFPRPTPYFVDRKIGTLCAVAHLLAFSGRDDIVGRVARADNNVLVAQLAGDTALAHWLDANGLKLVEAERIQIVYVEDPTPAVKRDNVALTALAWTAGATSVVTSIWNVAGNSDGHRPLTSTLGLAAGMVSTGMGFAMLAQHPADRIPAQLSVAAGLASIAFATQAMLQHTDVTRAQRNAKPARTAFEASVVPLLAMEGGAGVELSIRF